MTVIQNLVHQFPLSCIPSVRLAFASVWLTSVISLLPIPAWALDCLQFQIQTELASQAEVDSFQATYGSGAACDRILGTLSITGADITNLQGLSEITHIDGSLLIYSNLLLVDLEGLEKLVAVKESIHIGYNESLKNLDGLSALESSGHFTNFEFKYFRIIENPVLENVDALTNFVFARTYLYILDNPLLKNLDGFSNLGSALALSIGRNASLESLSGLSSMTGASLGVNIFDNPNLSSLDGLTGIQLTNGNLGVFRNVSLTSIEGLDSMQEVGSVVFIYQNPNLGDCSPLKALLDDVDDPPNDGPGPGTGGIPDVAGWAEVHSNSQGCNSIDQIFGQLFESGFEG